MKAQTNVPHFDDAVPHSDEIVPQLRDRVPHFDDRVPQFDDDVPQSDEGVSCKVNSGIDLRGWFSSKHFNHLNHYNHAKHFRQHQRLSFPASTLARLKAREAVTLSSHSFSRLLYLPREKSKAAFTDQSSSRAKISIQQRESASQGRWRELAEFPELKVSGNSENSDRARWGWWRR